VGGPASTNSKKPGLTLCPTSSPNTPRLRRCVAEGIRRGSTGSVAPARTAFDAPRRRGRGTVAEDADAHVEELRRTRIPYVVKGLNRIVGAPEIQAVVGNFRYMVVELDAVGLCELWEAADLLHEPALW